MECEKLVFTLPDGVLEKLDNATLEELLSYLNRYEDTQDE